MVCCVDCQWRRHRDDVIARAANDTLMDVDGFLNSGACLHAKMLETKVIRAKIE